MSTNDGAAQLRKMTADAKALQAQGKTNAEIAADLGISESYVRNLGVKEIEVIDWTQNCLTAGIHNGRDGSIWNIPLNYAIAIFSAETLRQLVVERIYSDAMQYVEHGEGFDQAWADSIKRYAEEHYRVQLQHKVGEISNYYKRLAWQADQEGIVERVKANTLNKGYEPLHPHDTINLLCRILGVGASQNASREA